ncbi:isochorismatase family protein [Dyella sp. M7H15-1]|uniref:isochorismatase family protein n=1 Tax=Dyella sp. M7H15-1 TaxID=2501295 RepID=UPI001004DEEA|nr:isochorismatase family protein [Dyella sp. M7H15-1]QAU23012.1 isochorismatase family protein [Dyella sp. M7H15-1]
MAIPKIPHYDAPTDVALSRSPLPWKLDVRRAALLVHDMQNYFLRPYESARFVHGIIDNIVAIRRLCHELNVPVYYTAQPGGQSKEHRGLLLDFWGAGMPQDDEATAIVPGLEPVPGVDQILVKHRYSAFARSDLLQRLRQAGRSQLVICGVYAHIGCMVTATDAFMADIQPFFVADALGDFSLAHHEMALRLVAHCSGRVLPAMQVKQALASELLTT